MAKNRKYDRTGAEEFNSSEQINYDTESKKEKKVLPSTETEAMVPETKTGTIVNSVVVKVRKAPNLESDVLEVLRKGDKVRIHKKLDNGFYKISTSVNGSAFILSDFIKED